MTAHEFRINNTLQAKAGDADKLEAIRNILRTYYFEADPWTGDVSDLYDENFSATDAIDAIVEILKK